MNEKIPDRTKSVIRKLLLLLCAAVLIEIVVFNFRSIQSLFYKSHSWEEYTVEYSGVKIYEGGIVSIEDGNARISLRDIGHEVKNIRLDLELLDAIDLFYLESGVYFADIDAWDEGGGEMRRLVTDWPVQPQNLTSQFHWLNTAGEVQGLDINVRMPAGHLFRINGITLNLRKPLDFSAVRFLAVWLVLLLCYGLRRQSGWWKDDCRQFAPGKKAVIGSVFLLFFGVSFFLMVSNETIINDAYNPYAELAWALNEGQVSLLEHPPHELLHLENPYDYFEREADGITYKFDFAYYNDRYYVYQGILPCLLFYLPLYHLTGLNMPNSVPVFFCSLLFGIGFFCLMRRVVIRYFPQTPFALLVLFLLTGLAGCQLPFFITQPVSYHLTIICAVMLVVWGLYFWISSKKEQQEGYSKVRMAAGSFCMALVAAVRPTLLVYSLLAFPLFWRVLLSKQENYKKKDKAGMAAALFVPYGIVVVPVMYYNAIRFGSVFEFGYRYLLADAATANTPFSLEKVAAAFYGFLLKLPEMRFRFPFFLQPEAWQNNGQAAIRSDTLFGGLLCFNVFLLAAAVVILKRREFCRRGLYAFSVMLFGLGVLLMIVDVELTGCVAYRYQADFAFALFMTAWLGIFWLQEASWGKASHNVFCRILVLLVFLSAVMNLMLLFVPYYAYADGMFHSLSLANGNTQLYYDIYYGFNFW